MNELFLFCLLALSLYSFREGVWERDRPLPASLPQAPPTWAETAPHAQMRGESVATQPAALASKPELTSVLIDGYHHSQPAPRRTVPEPEPALV